MFTRNFRSTLSLHQTICPLPSGVNLGQALICRVIVNWLFRSPIPDESFLGKHYEVISMRLPSESVTNAS